MISFTSQTSFLMLLLLLAAAFNKSICCNEKDQRALLTFNQGVKNLSWSTQRSCCSWVGVYCDNVTRRVTQLDIKRVDLEGTINLQALLQLEFLNYLDLSHNNFEAIIIPSFQVSRSDTYNQSLGTLSHQAANFSKISYLDLGDNNIRGQIPIALLRLGSLEVLKLSSNQFTGSIPDCLGQYGHLQYLDLRDNQLNGSIPDWLSQYQHLQYLDLSSNLFSGSIPDWLNQYEHLHYLDLSSNLFSGSIPSSLGNLSSLTHLSLSYNNLSSSLPESLGQLYNLTWLDVEGNSLVGVLSEKNFSNLSNLLFLCLGSNSFEFDFDPNWLPPFQLFELNLHNSSLGPNVPEWLYTQRSLAYLNISSSRISTIDHEDIFWSVISKISQVDLRNNSITGDLSNVTIYSTYIYLDDNNFTGGLPHISSTVYEFRASHNSFSGSLFSLLCQPVSSEENLLYFLDLSYNHLTGSLHDCWANWKQLGYVDLGSNMLTGEVPPSMAKLSNLWALDLHDNNFFGKFSLDISNWTNLMYLLLEKNKFSGSLPSTMQQNLAVMDMRSNQFTGNIPIQICNFSGLVILDLSHNMLSGSIPHCVYNIMLYNTEQVLETINIMTKDRELEFRHNIWMLRSIDLSSNNLSGEIPQQLLSLVQTWSLNLSRNHLTGKIPQNIGGMKNLESLDLSHNKLSGEIPHTISNLTFLECLNLSYNSFSGQIPSSTQLQSFEVWSFIGNPELCGDPLPKCNPELCGDALPTKCNKQEENDNPNLAKGNNDDDVFLKSLYLGMGIGFAVGFWGVCSSLFLNRAWRHNFFRWFDGVVDGVYVAMAIKFRNFR